MSLRAIVARDVAAYRRAWRRPLPFETSYPGLFAVADVRAGSIKRVAAAVGEGSAAVRSVHEYLAFAQPPAARYRVRRGPAICNEGDHLNFGHRPLASLNEWRSRL